MFISLFLILSSIFSFSDATKVISLEGQKLELPNQLATQTTYSININAISHICHVPVGSDQKIYVAIFPQNGINEQYIYESAIYTTLSFDDVKNLIAEKTGHDDIDKGLLGFIQIREQDGLNEFLINKEVVFSLETTTSSLEERTSDNDICIVTLSTPDVFIDTNNTVNLKKVSIKTLETQQSIVKQLENS